MGQGNRPEGFGMFILRLWMWAVPIMMLAAALLFGTIAASDGSWGLFVVMLVMAVMSVALFTFHWWVLYRFGRAEGRGEQTATNRKEHEQWRS